MRTLSIFLLFVAAASSAVDGWGGQWFQGYDDGMCYMTGTRNASSGPLRNATAVFTAIRSSSGSEHPVFSDMSPGEIAFVVTLPKERREKTFYTTVAALEIEGTAVTDLIESEGAVSFRARQPLSGRVLDELSNGNAVEMRAQTVDDVVVDISISAPDAEPFGVKLAMFNTCLSDGV